MTSGPPRGLPAILLVEDNPDDALLASLAIDEAGVSNPVVHVEDGHDALDHLAAEPVALVLLDLRLPRLDGHAVLAALRQVPDPDQTPILVMATSSDTPEVLGVDPALVDGIVSKPLQADDLRAAVATAAATEVEFLD